MVPNVEHQDRGTVRMLGFPMKFDHDPCEVQRPAPDVGEQNVETLEAAGFGANEIADLIAQNIICRALSGCPFPSLNRLFLKCEENTRSQSYPLRTRSRSV